jgi:hypothetical protein
MCRSMRVSVTAGDERDLPTSTVGAVALYQLSYSRPGLTDALSEVEQLCDDKKIVLPSARRSSSSWQNECCTSGSRPSVGSSKMTGYGR